jgi:PAS domain S-box-containing protein
VEALNDAVYRAMIDSPIIGFAHHRAILDGDGRPVDYEFLEVNATFEKLTGLSREAVLQRTVRDVLPGIETGEFDWIAFYGEVALGGGEKSFEQFSSPLGRWYQVHVYSTEKMFFSTIFIDITASKKQTQELEGFFSVNLDLLCIADLEGNFIKINEEWSHVLGYSTEELISHKFLEFVHPDDMDATLAAMSSLSQGDEVLDFTNRYRHQDGSYRYIEWRSHPHGTLIYAAARDITERIAAEEKLVTSEERFNRAISGTGAGLWDWDMVNDTVYFSPQWKKMLGYEDDEIPNNFSGWRKLWHPDDVSNVEKAVSDHLEGRSKIYEIEHRLLGKDGSWHWIITRGELEKDLTGKPIRWTGTNIDITDKKLAEEALRAREENFRNFFEAMQDMVVVATPAGRVLYANQSMIETLGYSLGELDKIGLLGVHSADNQAEAQEIFADMLRGERNYCPLPVEAKDGRLVPVETRATLGQWFGEECIFGVIKDISDEQAALQKFDKLFDVNPTAMALSRLPERQFVEVNKAFLQTTGYSREEVIGHSSAELGLFADPEYLQLTGELLQRDGFIRNLELQVTTKDGALREGLFSAEIIEVQGIRFVLTVMVDITERKEAEEQLAEMAFLQGFLIEIATSFIDVPLAAADNLIEYSLGEMGRFIGADRAYIFEYDWQGELTRNTFEWCAEGVAPQIDELQEVPLAAIASWAQTHRQGQIVVLEDVLALAAGDPLREILEPQGVCSMIVLPMLADGECMGFVGFDSVREKKTYSEDAQKLLFVFALMLVNLNRRNQTQAELAAALEAAEAASVAKGQFLANMSHEIRTPLNGVVGFLELLQLSRLNPEQAEYVRDAKGAADMLLNLINDILDFSKIEAGKLELEQVEFNLRSVVDDVVALLAGKAATKGLAFQAVINARVPEIVSGDPSRLKQVLSNLLSNAVKFTAVGEVGVSVDCPEAAVEQGVAVVSLTVKDTGIGISPEALAGLFQPFTQADASTTRKFGGTGLGLAISKQLVALMGGEVSAVSRPDEGSAFTIRLPLKVIKAGRDVPPTQVALAGTHVLLVDDNSTNRQIARSYLQEAGVLVTEVRDAGSAIAEIVTRAGTDKAFDAAVVDHQMPGMSGIELAAALSHIPSAQGIKLILFTSAAQRGSAQEAKDQGFAGFLSKPARRDEMLGCLATVLGLAPEDDTPQPLVTRHALREAEYAAGLRILLAEDNEINAKLVIRLLATQNLHCDVVADGEQAYQAATRRDYDLILMDCQMPLMDGYECTEKIRAWEEARRHTPIVALTAHAMEGDREKCLASGMDDYLSKPLKLDELFAVITRYTGQPATKAEATIPESGEVSAPEKNLADRQAIFAAVIGLGLDEVAEIFADFSVYLPEVLQEISAAVAEQNATATAILAHKLKGTAGTLRLSELSEPAGKLEAIFQRREEGKNQAATPTPTDWLQASALLEELHQVATIIF